MRSSRAFLVAVVVGCGVVAFVMAKDGHYLSAAIVAAAAVYFALRILGVLGGGDR